MSNIFAKKRGKQNFALRYWWDVVCYNLCTLQCLLDFGSGRFDDKIMLCWMDTFGISLCNQHSKNKRWEDMKVFEEVPEQWVNAENITLILLGDVLFAIYNLDTITKQFLLWIDGRRKRKKTRTNIGKKKWTLISANLIFTKIR